MANHNSDQLEPPTSIDPYAVLDIPTTATAAEVRSSYRKLALRLHPDKAAPADSDSANKAFQHLAFAYAILSDERRRKRYDATGNTSETLDLDDDDFNWTDFFRTQFSELITTERIAEFQRTYQKSEEERKDVLEAYRKGKGSLDKIFENVVLSNPLEDEVRFRTYIDDAITNGELESYKAYAEESEKSRQRRHKRAQKEKEEASAHAHELGVGENNKPKRGKKAKGKTEDLTDLALLIQQRNGQRRENFLDGLLDKYGGKENKRGAKRGSPVAQGEPSEEAFAEMGRRKKQKVNEKDGDKGADGEQAGSAQRAKRSQARNVVKAQR
ncbi:hypothetical protein MMC10_002550 [Thelotrema lepadinum]|nr:hypothetical protein [Thelotrema lepadinum]